MNRFQISILALLTLFATSAWAQEQTLEDYLASGQLEEVKELDESESQALFEDLKTRQDSTEHITINPV